jgi:hypothetical protein
VASGSQRPLVVAEDEDAVDDVHAEEEDRQRAAPGDLEQPEEDQDPAQGVQVGEDVPARPFSSVSGYEPRAA